MGFHSKCKLKTVALYVEGVKVDVIVRSKRLGDLGRIGENVNAGFGDEKLNYMLDIYANKTPSNFETMKSNNASSKGGWISR
jgi:hypothetical protein